MSILGRSPAFQTFGLPSAKASPAAHQPFAPPAGPPLSHMQASVSTTGNAMNKTVHEAWDVGGNYHHGCTERIGRRTWCFVTPDHVMCCGRGN